MSYNKYLDDDYEFLRRVALSKPTQDLAGVQTFVRRDDSVEEGKHDQDRTKDVANPQAQGTSSEERRPLNPAYPSAAPKMVFNTPPPGGGLPTVRTLGKPGELGGVPYIDTPLIRRRSLTAKYFWREEKKPSDWEGVKPSRQTGTPDPDFQHVPEGTVNWQAPSAHVPAYLDRKDNKHPATKQDFGTVDQASGTAKVIPWNADSNTTQKDLSMLRRAGRATLRQIMRKAGPDVQYRSSYYHAQPDTIDLQSGMRTYDVGKWRVTLVSPPLTMFDEVLDSPAQIRCTCPAWRWQGSEHWAHQGGYMHGAPVGDLSFPGIRDPFHKNPVCKHVYAVFRLLETQSSDSTTKLAANLYPLNRTRGKITLEDYRRLLSIVDE